MTNKYDLHLVEWGEFKIDDILKIGSGKDVNLDGNVGDVPYVNSSGINNGITNYIKNPIKLVKNVITVARTGTVGATFYQKGEVCVSGNIRVLTPRKITLNSRVASFLILSLTKSFQDKFHYGKILGTKRLKVNKVLLPKNSSGNPDWDFMEGYMREKEKQQLETALSYYKKKIGDKNMREMSLENCEWKDFEIGSLFSLFPGKSKGLNHLKIHSFGVNYLGATNRNNGVLCQVEKNEKMMQKGNCIAFIRNGEGSMGYSIYKAEDFIATSDISVGYSDFLTQNIGLFITTVADRVRGKYNFGYKRSDTRLKKEKILLPANSKGEPDWKFIEQYMQHQEQKLVKKYIDFAESRLAVSK